MGTFFSQKLLDCKNYERGGGLRTRGPKNFLKFGVFINTKIIGTFFLLLKKNDQKIFNRKKIMIGSLRTRGPKNLKL